MIEIRDTFRGGEDAEISASRWSGMGKGYPPPHPTRGFGGTLQAPPTGALAKNGFGMFLAQQNVSLTRKKT